MARVFSLMTCVMLFLAVEHGVLRSPLRSMQRAVPENESSTEDGLRGIVATLVGAVKSLRNDLQKVELKLKIAENKLEAVTTQTSDLGSMFVCWGRRQCPYQTKLVYSGVAGGKQYDYKGGGTNRLCLTRSPQYDNTPVTAKSYGRLFGAEYQDITNHLDHNVPCAVCRAPYSTIIMMAATLNCPQGWTALYKGHLTSAQKNEYATEYVCLDANPENIDNGRLKNENGLLFYYVISVCGSLPCPPYKNRKIVTCVVCSR